MESNTGSKRQGTDNLIGQSASQSVNPVQIANQSERCSNGVADMDDDEITIKTEKLDDGASRSKETVSQSRTCPEGGSTTRDGCQGRISASSHHESVTALSLLDSIQQGIIPTEPESDQSTSNDAFSNMTHKHDPILVESSETPNMDATTSRKPDRSETPDPKLIHSKPAEKHVVYLDVMDWRRFVKPLPRYQDITEGWCKLGDVVLSMPVVIFCKVIPVRYVVRIYT